MNIIFIWEDFIFQRIRTFYQSHWPQHMPEIYALAAISLTNMCQLLTLTFVIENISFISFFDPPEIWLLLVVIIIFTLNYIRFLRSTKFQPISGKIYGHLDPFLDRNPFLKEKEGLYLALGYILFWLAIAVSVASYYRVSKSPMVNAEVSLNFSINLLRIVAPAPRYQLCAKDIITLSK